MITARIPGGGNLLLLAPVRGLVSEAPAVVAALERHAADAVGLGISPEELRGFVEYFVHSRADPVVPLTSAERSEVRGLVRFGEVAVPNPSFLAILRWAGARAVPTEGLDPSEDETATLFADNIGYLELVRRTGPGTQRRPQPARAEHARRVRPELGPPRGAGPGLPAVRRSARPLPRPICPTAGRTPCPCRRGRRPGTI